MQLVNDYKLFIFTVSVAVNAVLGIKDDNLRSVVVASKSFTLSINSVVFH
jgi:hypothetical protein